jgi:uncharacterized protein (DUF885 family)
MPDAPTATAVNALAGAFWEGFLERTPTYGTHIGDERYDDRLDDPGPEGRALDRAAVAGVHERAAAMDRRGLDVEDRITLDMLETATRIRLAEHDQHLYELAAVDQLAGAQQLPGELAAVQRVDTPERFDRLLARLGAYPAYIDAWIGILQDAVTSGRMAAPAVMARTLEQVERMVATPVDDSPLVVRPSCPATRRSGCGTRSSATSCPRTQGSSMPSAPWRRTYGPATASGPSRTGTPSTAPSSSPRPRWTRARRSSTTTVSHRSNRSTANVRRSRASSAMRT